MLDYTIGYLCSSLIHRSQLRVFVGIVAHTDANPRKEMEIVTHNIHPNASDPVAHLLLGVRNSSVAGVALGRVLLAARAGTLTFRAGALARHGATVALGLAVAD